MPRINDQHRNSRHDISVDEANYEKAIFNTVLNRADQGFNAKSMARKANRAREY